MMKKEMTHTPKVSVVIPMYNCEEFVPDLLGMFSEQSLDDFEVVCVIDGATDGTEEAVKEYCKTDDRFRYVARENGGAGAARNTGIDEAKGKYIVFPDADDIYSKDYLLKLYDAADGPDAEIAVCNYYVFDHMAGEERDEKGFNDKLFEEGKVYSAKRKRRILKNIHVRINSKMYRLDFIVSNGLRFSETKATNDLFFSKASLAAAERITVVQDKLITVRRYLNPDSITSNRGQYSPIALGELHKLYNRLKDTDMLRFCMPDYLFYFDGTLNYEMKCSINPVFAEELVRMLVHEEPWKDLTAGQIMKILRRSMGAEGNEAIVVPDDNADAAETEKIRLSNEIKKMRNANKLRNQELIKKIFLDKYGRDLEFPESRSPAQIPLDNTGQRKPEAENLNAPEVTVVIPMYNCEDFAQDVLNMFAAQSFSEYEVICVIDGATDNTEQIVKDFCDKDPRFRYTARENGGAGAARNTGLDMAKGRYITWADADDEYSPDFLKKLYETAVRFDAQIVVCRFEKINKKTHEIVIHGFNPKEYHEGIVYSHCGIDDIFISITARVTNKLFNTEFVRKNGLRFSETRISNDTFFCCAGLSVADRILVIDDILLKYKFHINPDSVTSGRQRNLHEAILTLRQLYNWLKDKSLLETHEEDFMKRTDDVLYLNESYRATPIFISEAVHMLNAEEPWNRMTSGKILEFLKRSIFAEDDIRNEAEISRLSPELTESDAELGFLFAQFKNRVHTSQLLRKVSLERYGRDFSKEDSLPELFKR